MPRILVTGGEGFVGSRVVAQLRGDGHEVWSTSIEPTSASRVIGVDLRSRDALRGRLEGFDAVVHLAARAGGIGFQRSTDVSVFLDNRSMTDAVLTAAIEAGVGRILLASSSVVYRPQAVRPHPESDPTLRAEDGPSPYAWSKICDEVVAQWSTTASGPSVVVSRFANVYGPGGPSADSTGTVVHTLVRRALEAAAEGRSTFVAHGDPHAIRSFIHVDDVARAVALLVLDQRAVGIYNVDTGIGASIESVAKLIAAAVAPGLSPAFTESPISDTPYRVSDPSRIAALGFAAGVSFDAGVTEYVVTVRDRPPAVGDGMPAG